MPYVSRAQAGKFHVLEREGKIAPSVVSEWDAASRGLKLPWHARKQTGRKKLKDVSR